MGGLSRCMREGFVCCSPALARVEWLKGANKWIRENLWEKTFTEDGSADIPVFSTDALKAHYGKGEPLEPLPDKKIKKGSAVVLGRRVLQISTGTERWFVRLNEGNYITWADLAHLNRP